MEKSDIMKSPRLLGIEGGATHTTAAYKAGERIETETFGPGNMYTVSEIDLIGLFEKIHNRFPEADCVVAGMAGARNEADFEKIRSFLKSLWTNATCIGTNDLEVGIANALSPENVPKILIIAGTGSCAYGKSSDGKVVKVGAWGHVFGDTASAYYLGITAMRIIAMHYDEHGTLDILGKKILQYLSLNSLDDLVEWAKTAKKDEIASIAKVIFEMAKDNKEIALKALNNFSEGIRHLVYSCSNRLFLDARKSVEILLSGGIFKHNKWLLNSIKDEIKRDFINAEVNDISDTSYLGAIKLAEKYYQENFNRKKLETESAELPLFEKGQLEVDKSRERNDLSRYLPALTELSPTELPNPLSRDLDKMPLEDAIRLFIREDAKIPDAISPCVSEIARAIEIISNSFKQGGRLIYVGAGTSGRIAMLDAAECPPTFGVEPTMVQAVIAGGAQALQRSIEGAEDDFFAGHSEIIDRNVDQRDVVFGIAASGTTKFVWGALSAANKCGAKTILLCFNPNLKMPTEVYLNVVICPNTGPELLTGSTRLKAGTATKMILNIISTLSMAQTGRIKGNLMLKMLPTNEKLRQRAVRIVSQAGNVPPETARELLEKSNWDIQSALDKAVGLAS